MDTVADVPVMLVVLVPVLHGRSHPGRDAEADPMVSLTMEIPQLPVDTVIDVQLCRWSEFHRCRRGEVSCAPTAALGNKLVAGSS